jgi:hypothetical protein
MFVAVPLFAGPMVRFIGVEPDGVSTIAHSRAADNAGFVNEIGQLIATAHEATTSVAAFLQPPDASGAMPKDRRQVGFSVGACTLDDLDDVADHLADVFDRAPSKSDAARTTLPLGIAAWQAMESEMGREIFAMDSRERKALVRQAVLNFCRERDDETDV